ncbi:hypothetical protein B0A71_13830 [Flavobacterium tructae]|uniref:Uncharacterized protein n=1 Tax=Flavobacterium tructae TaxID=1114873 RepID=A0A1S1J214_9FLAO|nr:hypothetical protein BHE19_18145 [Flavobacterium tructae]OXB18924.1 hypothetical protein B0A71_13830 [Flavobacterium tructae]
MPIGFDGIDIALICSELEQRRKNPDRGDLGGLSFIRCKAGRGVFFSGKGAPFTEKRSGNQGGDYFRFDIIF